MQTQSVVVYTPIEHFFYNSEYSIYFFIVATSIFACITSIYVMDELRVKYFKKYLCRNFPMYFGIIVGWI